MLSSSGPQVANTWGLNLEMFDGVELRKKIKGTSDPHYPLDQRKMKNIVSNIFKEIVFVFLFPVTQKEAIFERFINWSYFNFCDFFTHSYIFTDLCKGK